MKKKSSQVIVIVLIKSVPRSGLPTAMIIQHVFILFRRFHRSMSAYNWEQKCTECSEHVTRQESLY